MVDRGPGLYDTPVRQPEVTQVVGSDENLPLP